VCRFSFPACSEKFSGLYEVATSDRPKPRLKAGYVFPGHGFDDPELHWVHWQFVLTYNDNLIIELRYESGSRVKQADAERFVDLVASAHGVVSWLEKQY
jgi:hypothetical protein